VEDIRTIDQCTIRELRSEYWRLHYQAQEQLEHLGPLGKVQAKIIGDRMRLIRREIEARLGTVGAEELMERIGIH